ncbi:MAG: ATP-binding cassette domain-containing protein [Muribaculaceae bacterium]|nr:ATP-binding cassette domain-containing protein [Muribaculaceae bacterium]
MEDILVKYEDVAIKRQDKTVLKDVNFILSPSTFYYLVGKVGSGKSSLMKSMYADVEIASGEIAEVMGFNLLNIKKKEIPFLRRKLGIVFQDFQLLQGRSVFSNLEFVLKATGWHNKEEISARIEEVLKEVGMANKSYKMPHELSGGEQQRIVIARSLLNSPRLILADEPTGNLDPNTGFQILTLLHRLVETGHTVLMATHNLQLLEDFPGKVFRCVDKQLIADFDSK